MADLVGVGGPAADGPNLTTALKNFAAYRMAAIATDPTSAGPHQTLRRSNIEILLARAVARAINRAEPAEGDVAMDVRGRWAMARLGGLSTAQAMGRSLLRDAGAAAQVRSKLLEGTAMVDEAAAFFDAFLLTALDDADDLIWSPDFKAALQRRHAKRKADAKERLENQAGYDLDALRESLGVDTDEPKYTDL
ncbi:hypothetical protein M885DRAFT_514293 [Pelagophyceae sp. CCMP2097]|nr:hypothetical protein M885DRAFT_514293 [Pelagophyceae sp. CCMP2097]